MINVVYTNGEKLIKMNWAKMMSRGGKPLEKERIKVCADIVYFGYGTLCNDS